MHAGRRRVLGGVAGLLLLFTSVSSGFTAPTVLQSLDVTVAPGEEARVSIPVASFREQADLRMDVLRAEVQFDESFEFRALSAEERAWIQLQGLQTFSESEEIAQVELRLAPPQDVAPQVLQLAVVFQEPEQRQGGISIVTSTATLIFVTIGDVPAGYAACSNLSVQREKDQVTVTTVLTNSDQGILQPQGDVVVRGVFHLPLATTPLNADRHRLLSHQTRSFITTVALPRWYTGPITYEVPGMMGCSARTEAAWHFWPTVIVGAGLLLGGGGKLWLRRRR